MKTQPVCMSVCVCMCVCESVCTCATSQLALTMAHSPLIYCQRLLFSQDVETSHPGGIFKVSCDTRKVVLVVCVLL